MRVQRSLATRTIVESVRNGTTFTFVEAINLLSTRQLHQESNRLSFQRSRNIRKAFTFVPRWNSFHVEEAWVRYVFFEISNSKKKKYWKIFLNVWVFFTVEKSYFKKYILVRGGIFLNNSKLFNFRAYELINTRAFRLSKHRIKERSRRLYINKGNGRSGVQSDYTRSISHLPFGFRLRRTRSSIRDELVAFIREIADRRFAIFSPAAPIASRFILPLAYCTICKCDRCNLTVNHRCD